MQCQNTFFDFGFAWPKKMFVVKVSILGSVVLRSTGASTMPSKQEIAGNRAKDQHFFEFKKSLDVPRIPETPW